MARISEQADGCWLWTGHVTKTGYGLFTIRLDGEVRTRLVHRLVYGLLRGPIEGQLHHMCKVRRCVNPEHLRPISPKEHGQEHAADRLRQTCIHGHPMAEAYIIERTMPDGSIRPERRCAACQKERNARSWANKPRAERRRLNLASSKRRRERKAALGLGHVDSG